MKALVLTAKLIALSVLLFGDLEASGTRQLLKGESKIQIVGAR